MTWACHAECETWTALEHLEVAYTLSFGWEEQEFVAHVVSYLASRLPWNMSLHKDYAVALLRVEWLVHSGSFLEGPVIFNFTRNLFEWQDCLFRFFFSYLFLIAQQYVDVQTGCVEFPTPCAQ